MNKKIRVSKLPQLWNNKRWIVTFLIMTFAGIMGLGLYNYFFDPYQYFGNRFRKEWTNSQYYKVRYIMNNLEEYNCFILGGSNSGAIDPDLIDSYNQDYKTYSLSFALGNYYSYYDYTKFLIDNTDVKCIFLHLSSTEITVDDTFETIDAYKMPALINGNAFGLLEQNLSFLLKSVKLKYGRDKHKIFDNGKLDWSYYIDKYDDAPKQYIEKNVLASYQDKINTLGLCETKQDRIEENLDIMKEIKTMCDENGTQLIVLCGPVFISKRADFECNAYYDYLEKLVEITDIYDFSGITEINANPYNFFDLTHYNYKLADEEIKFIFGECDLTQEFGVLLTKDNIVEYLCQRKLAFESMKEEVATTGTVEYGSYDDESRVEKY